VLDAASGRTLLSAWSSAAPMMASASSASPERAAFGDRLQGEEMPQLELAQFVRGHDASER